MENRKKMRIHLEVK